MGIWQVVIGLAIPFLGTALGSFMVFFIRKEIKPRVEKLLLGFASGVMIAASVWSLLLPAISLSEASGAISWLPAAIGFLCGIGFLLVLDRVTPHLHAKAESAEVGSEKLKKSTMLVLAVTLHNIPEGMAAGVAFAGVLAGNVQMSLAGAFVLAIGLAIQNFPEGAVISMPLVGAGVSKKKAFLMGAMSGVVEPIAGAITILLASLTTAILPYLLAFAAGAMIYVVAEELIPDAHDGASSDIGTIGLAVGFVLMMILDIAFG